ADLTEHVHLVGGESGAVVLAHGLDHVIDQPLDLWRADLARRHRRRRLPQHRMSEASDLQDGHGVLSGRIVAYGPSSPSAPPARVSPSNLVEIEQLVGGEVGLAAHHRAPGLTHASIWERSGAARRPRDSAAGRPRRAPGTRGRDTPPG